MDPVRIPPPLFNQDKRNGFKRSSWSDDVDTATATGSKHLFAGCQSVPVSQTRLRRHPSPPKVKAAAKSKALTVKSDWVDPPNGEARKRDEQAENVKTGEQALIFFETIIKFIDGNPESGQDYINNYSLSLPMIRHIHTNPERGVWGTPASTPSDSFLNDCRSDEHLLGGFAHLSADEGDKSRHLSGSNKDSEGLGEGGLPQTSVEEVEEGGSSKRALIW
ncbi:hypothetical protein EDB83DRAFT_2314707 [Lactarius deliciosus]|nr:hypothetical protein EDB83DRAFT_2314707 [Lactarius deliciosus]